MEIVYLVLYLIMSVVMMVVFLNTFECQHWELIFIGVIGLFWWVVLPLAIMGWIGVISSRFLSNILLKMKAH